MFAIPAWIKLVGVTLDLTVFFYLGANMWCYGLNIEYIPWPFCLGINPGNKSAANYKIIFKKL